MQLLHQKTSDLRVIVIDSLGTLLEQWPFMQDGLERMQSSFKAFGRVSPEALLKLVLRAVGEYPKGGVVFVVHSMNTPAFYGIVCDCSTDFTPRTCCVYAMYSSGSPEATKAAMDFITDWARKQEFRTVQTWSPRINGSGFRFFEKSMGFKRCAVLFEKAI